MTASDGRMNSESAKATFYFDAMKAALGGLDRFLAGADSPLYQHGLIEQTVAPYVARLMRTFACWEHRIGFAETFRISRAESGFPAYRNVLELENDRKQAKKRLAELPEADALRAEMVDHILTERSFPGAAQKRMAERAYLEAVREGAIFRPFVLPETIRVSVNPKTRRPYYVVHWGLFDGTQSLPMVYMAVIEDSSEELGRMLVTRDGRLNDNITIPLPVGGLLNPDLAHEFDDFAKKNSGYGLTLATIATNLDKDFEGLHPKQLRRFVLGPFYSAGITEHGGRVGDILSKVRTPENGWLMTWTVQEILSVGERPGRRGLWNAQPPSEEFHIDTADLEAVRQGVSHYAKHALVPHEAYQALYASGQAADMFDGFEVHVISGGHITSGV